MHCIVVAVVRDPGHVNGVAVVAPVDQVAHDAHRLRDCLASRPPPQFQATRNDRARQNFYCCTRWRHRSQERLRPSPGQPRRLP